MNFQTPDYIRAVVADRERDLRNIQLAHDARRARRENRAVERRSRPTRQSRNPLGALVPSSRKAAVE